MKLVTLDDKVPLTEKPDDFAVHEPDCKELIAFLKAMEFGSITRRVAAHFHVEDMDAIDAAPTVANVLPPKPELPELSDETPAADRRAEGAHKPRRLCHRDHGQGTGQVDRARPCEWARSASIPKPPAWTP